MTTVRRDELGVSLEVFLTERAQEQAVDVGVASSTPM
jgi:hypothetical protein